MKWINRGLFFKSEDWIGGGTVRYYAQSPQTVTLGDRHRIYFTSREWEPASSTWFSFPVYVDVDLEFRTVLDEPKRVNYEKAVLGGFDEHGIFPFSPLIVEGTYFAYTTGWSRRRSVSVETSIGLMVSDDGITFKRFGQGPILSASVHEPFLVCDGFVRKIEESWVMWYLFGTEWVETPVSGASPERVYKIGVATSKDGINWTPSGGTPVIPNVIGPREAQALPSVQLDNGRYEMVFCYRGYANFRENPAQTYRLGYATSNDGYSWTRDDSLIQIPRSDFDSEMQCYPNLVVTDEGKYVLFNGNDFGKYGFGVAECIQDC